MVSRANIIKGEQRREKMLEFIQQYVETNGFSPTFSEIADATGLSSPNATRAHLKRLEADGLIKMRPRIARAITLTAA